MYNTRELIRQGISDNFNFLSILGTSCRSGVRQLHQCLRWMPPHFSWNARGRSYCQDYDLLLRHRELPPRIGCIRYTCTPRESGPVPPSTSRPTTTERPRFVILQYADDGEACVSPHPTANPGRGFKLLKTSSKCVLPMPCSNRLCSFLLLRVSLGENFGAAAS